MDATMMSQATAFYFQHESRGKAATAAAAAAMYPAVRALPSTPMFSPAPTLLSNGPSAMAHAAMTPTSSPQPPPPQQQKPAIVLETEMADGSYLPATPPLSTSGSTMGSPRSCEVLQTPMNPMFSGLEDLGGVKMAFDPVDMISVLEWTGCGSPPMTPVYLQQAQPASALSLSGATSDPSSCPSLSPSPTPYARSVASESDVDFCDPRNLTVSAALPAELHAELPPALRLSAPGHDAAAAAAVKASAAPPAHAHALALGLHAHALAQAQAHAHAHAQPAFDFATPDGLPVLEDLSDCDSDDGFASLVTVDLAERPPPADVSADVSRDVSRDLSRPRACTASSVVSLGHGSFIGDEDPRFDGEAFSLSSLPSPPSSNDSLDDAALDDGLDDDDLDAHDDKRQRRSASRSIGPAMDSAADSPSGHHGQQRSDKAASVVSDSNGSSGSDAAPAPTPAPTNRRGRKQSLTEDPSKTFVCDLCNRRFRRQEHLKRHYRSLHTQEKPFECNECGKKFSRSDNLAQHARTHAGGAIVMNLIENGDASVYDASIVSAPASDDYANYGKVLFQIASEIPGSASELSSDEGNDQAKRKRKRAD